MQGPDGTLGLVLEGFDVTRGEMTLDAACKYACMLLQACDVCSAHDS